MPVKITNPITIERHMLVGSYFCEHVFRLFDFDMDDMILFDIKYFFQVAYQVLLIIKILIYFIKC